MITGWCRAGSNREIRSERFSGEERTSNCLREKLFVFKLGFSLKWTRARTRWQLIISVQFGQELFERRSSGPVDEMCATIDIFLFCTCQLTVLCLRKSTVQSIILSLFVATAFNRHAACLCGGRQQRRTFKVKQWHLRCKKKISDKRTTGLLRKSDFGRSESTDVDRVFD